MAASSTTGSLLPVIRSWVRGRTWQKAISQSTYTGSFDLFDPVTAEKRATLETAAPDCVNTAIEAAVEAQVEWKSVSPSDRAKVLLNAAHILHNDGALIDEIAILETADTGRPVNETRHEAPGAADCLRWFAGLAPSVGGQMLDLGGTTFGYTRREPLGVCGMIGAWNYPMQSAVWKSAPALAFGNACIFKPSELTPSTALKLAQVYQEAGLPDGLYNVVLGQGHVGHQLVQDSRIAKISFTGSVSTGRAIYTQAAQQFKKVTLEMGGKSPLIVFDDANLDDAVTAAMFGNWYSSGQVCSNGTRVFVHASLMERFLEKLVDRTQRLTIGDPRQDKTDIGPMVSKEHMQKVQEYIRIGIEDDKARLVYGGGEQLTLGDPSCQGGYFMRPTIFADCSDDMRIVQEEIFGMVMSVLSFETEGEVLQRANMTAMKDTADNPSSNGMTAHFGLAAGVFTQDLQRAHRMVAHLEAGTTWINNYNLSPVELPWGGFHDSGIGSENGRAGVESWTRMKSVYVEGRSIESPFSA